MTLREKLEHDKFTITVELDPPKSSDAKKQSTKPAVC